MGHRHRQLGQRLLQSIGDVALVHGIDIGEQEADRHRPDLLALQVGCELIDLVVVWLLNNLPVATHAAPELEAVGARGQGEWLAPFQAVEIAAIGLADEDHVAKAAVGHECDAGAAPLEQRVGHDRRAVDEVLD